MKSCLIVLTVVGGFFFFPLWILTIILMLSRANKLKGA